MHVWQLVLLIVIGLISGFLNVLAGGGSMLTLPIMIMMGMPGAVANGTNRIGILLQNISAVAAFFKKGVSDLKLSISLSLCALPGAIIGAYIGRQITGIAFQRILGILMLALTVLMSLRKKTGSQAKQTLSAMSSSPTNLDPSQVVQPPTPIAQPSTSVAQPQNLSPTSNHILSRTRYIWGHIFMLGSGFYGGFIQAGVGFIVIAILHKFMGLNMVRVNLHKVFIAMVYTVPSIIIFGARGLVWWGPGLVLSMGTIIGGWIGSHVTVAKGDKIIGLFLIIMMLAFSVKLLFF